MATKKTTASKPKAKAAYSSPHYPNIKYQLLHAATEKNLCAVSKKFGLKVHKRNKNGNIVLRCRQFRDGSNRPTDARCQYRGLFVADKKAIYAIAGRTHDHKMAANRTAKGPANSSHIQQRKGVIKRQKPELTTADGEEEEGTSSSSNIGRKRRQGKKEQQPVESESDDETDEDEQNDGDDEDGAILEEDNNSDDEEEEEEVQEQLDGEEEEGPNDKPPKKILCRTDGRKLVLYNFHRKATAAQVPAICKDLGLQEYKFHMDGNISLRCKRFLCSHAGIFVAKYKAVYVTEEKHWTTDEEDDADEDENKDEEEAMDDAGNDRND